MVPQVNSSSSPKNPPWPILGLSGGIATGKSTASRYLEKKGARVIDADEIARRVVKPETALFKQICQTFQKQLGDKLLTSAGELNRKFLNEKIFTEPIFREKFENLIHPEIYKEISRLILEYQKDPAHPLIVLSAPLLFESGLNQKCQANLVISCSPQNQRTRLEKRDGYTSEQANLRIQTQMPLKEKIQKADWVIANDSTPEDLYQALEKIRPKILDYFRIP